MLLSKQELKEVMRREAKGLQEDAYRLRVELDAEITLLIASGGTSEALPVDGIQDDEPTLDDLQRERQQVLVERGQKRAKIVSGVAKLRANSVKLKAGWTPRVQRGIGSV